MRAISALFLIPMFIASVATADTNLGAAAPADNNSPSPAAPATRSIGHFTNIQAAGAIELLIQKSAGPAVSIETDADTLSRVVTDVTDETLVVYVRGAQPSGPVKVTIGAPSLQQLSMSGACQATLENFSGKALTLNVSGASKLNASGSAEKVTLLASGAAQVKARELHAATEVVQISGAGQYEVCASKSLSVIMNGASDVAYACNPGQFRQNIHGAGSVHAVAN